MGFVVGDDISVNLPAWLTQGLLFTLTLSVKNTTKNILDDCVPW
jgi:hypothetical protein